MRKALLTLAVLAATPLSAQSTRSRADRFMANCEDYGDRDRERFCEIRDVTMKVPTRALFVDGRDNGGVSFYGADRGDIQVKALISATADTRKEAEALAKDIKIVADGDRLYADGPSNRRYSWWSVSFEVTVPKKSNLSAETGNGGISVEGVEGRLDLRAVNGGVSLRDVGGDVRASTTNGGASAVLTGDRWVGEGLELETTNGGVTLEIPRNYNARLETGTVNGGMNIDFPITVQGYIGRRITTTLGQGGPRVRATTTNGGVRIRER